LAMYFVQLRIAPQNPKTPTSSACNLIKNNVCDTKNFLKKLCTTSSNVFFSKN